MYGDILLFWDIFWSLKPFSTGQNCGGSKCFQTIKIIDCCSHLITFSDTGLSTVYAMLNLLNTIYTVKLLGIFKTGNRLKISTALVAGLSHFYNTLISGYWQK
jgi:hypothetical protein